MPAIPNDIDESIEGPPKSHLLHFPFLTESNAHGIFLVSAIIRPKVSSAVGVIVFRNFVCPANDTTLIFFFFA